MGWEVEVTDEFAAWYGDTDTETQESINAAVEILEEMGPGLGRPFVDTLQGSRIPNLKELRPPGGFIRIIFAFDPRRAAILLLGGDKSQRWSLWYREAIPKAEGLYDEYLEELKKEGLIPCIARFVNSLLPSMPILSGGSGSSAARPLCGMC